MTDVKFNALMWVYDVYHLSRMRRGFKRPSSSMLTRLINGNLITYNGDTFALTSDGLSALYDETEGDCGEPKAVQS